MLKMFFGVLLFSAVTAFDSPRPQQMLPQQDFSEATRCTIKNTAFQSGEELTYKLYYNWNFIWLSAGEVTFKVTELGSQYHLSAVGSTYSSYEWFFKVRDHYQAFIDKSSLLPAVSIRDVHEGGYRLYDKLTYDHSNKKVTSLRGKTKNEAKETTYQVGDCMHDVLSIIYYVRNVNYDNMKTGEKIPVNIFIDKEQLPLQVTYKGREKNKKIKGLGTFNTLKVSPQLVDGVVFKADSQMSVYATDDGNRIPLLIESPVSVGSVKAVLKSYKGLKYDLSSKVGG